MCTYVCGFVLSDTTNKAGSGVEGWRRKHPVQAKAGHGRTTGVEDKEWREGGDGYILVIPLRKEKKRHIKSHRR